ncbi:hypothetical protein EK904_001515, partial [Melospiza melodia maxima]
SDPHCRCSPAARPVLFGPGHPWTAVVDLTAVLSPGLVSCWRLSGEDQHQDALLSASTATLLKKEACGRDCKEVMAAWCHFHGAGINVSSSAMNCSTGLVPWVDSQVYGSFLSKFTKSRETRLAPQQVPWSLSQCKAKGDLDISCTSNNLNSHSDPANSRKEYNKMVVECKAYKAIYWCKTCSCSDFSALMEEGYRRMTFYKIQRF